MWRLLGSLGPVGRAVAYAVGVLVVLVLVLAPLLGSGVDGDAGSGTETSTITDYRARFVVDGQGTLRATETLRVDFPISRHGIFRFFDVDDPSDDHVRLVPHDIAVTRDGESEQLEMSKQGQGRYAVARIGDPDVTIDGEHTYVIRYTVPGVLASGPGSGSSFYYNLIPGGWQMPIQRSSLRLTLPADPSAVRCAVGTGSTTGCTADVAGRTLGVRTDALAPHTPVTVRTSLALAPPGQQRLPWSSRLDPVLGRSVPLAIVFAVLSLLGLLGGYLAARSVRERPPAYPLMYAPPDGIGPAQGVYLLQEKVDDDAFAATVLQLGEKGVASVEHDGDDWRVTGLGGAWDALDDTTRRTAADLGISEGRTFKTRPDEVEDGEQLQSARRRFDVHVRDWARERGLVETSGKAWIGRLVVGGCVLVAGYSFFGNALNFSLFGLPFGWFAVLALPLLDSRSASFRTKAGRETWSRVGGFRRVLGTTSSEARFDFSGRQELYLQYVPWAVAFGVADVWAQKYRVEVREEPPVPAYFMGGYVPMGGSIGGSMGDFSDSFNSSVGSAISAYQATQSSSSSGGGGGGFSGGGGGGGGGGGSW